MEKIIVNLSINPLTLKALNDPKKTPRNEAKKIAKNAKILVLNNFSKINSETFLLFK